VNSRLQSAKARERGQAILEMALILPVFCLIGFGLMDVQLCLERAANADYIAQETARCEAIEGIPCTAQTAEDYAIKKLGADLRMYPPQLVVVTPPCIQGVSCSVTVTYHFQAIGVWFPSITITRTGTAAVPPLLP
jgi:Flp pilus assembly protein TadG